ncbi:MAG: hypothetical protein CVT48_00685 [Thermoplasmata archaeon HGW-Thermoplasmata-1]|nr:MAG: hypothetical protein CVT48_00685 [Thermoplasmata archaeon HGW-Thermoplasmata-1]
MPTARFELEFCSFEEAKVIYETILPEVQQKIPRAKAAISLQNNLLILEISARDTPALRAASNSYLKWIKTARDVERVARK